jgi:hypothetical protein
MSDGEPQGPTAEAFPALAELLADSDRVPIEGARPVLRRLEDEEPELEAELARLGPLEVALERRGLWCGRWIELPEELDPRARLPRASRQRQRVREARPLVWRGWLSEALPRWRSELFRSERLPARFAAALDPARELRAWIAGQLGARGSDFVLLDEAAPLEDPQRDLAKLLLRAKFLPPDGPPLWAKLGRLSDHPGDASLRLRLGFGREVDDDDNPDPRGLEAVARLAARLWPERAAIAGDRRLWAALAELFDAPLRPSQDILYWNRPQGGARFHHDAFREQDDAQRGVLFAQLAGRTAWAALSIADLARRALEFRAELARGEAPWVLEELAPSGALEALDSLAADPLALRRELGLPGQGRLGPLIDQAPEFLGFLAERGHAAILHPGDLILLPNHGRLATAMHSVFCASNAQNLALSLGLFPSR